MSVEFEMYRWTNERVPVYVHKNQIRMGGVIYLVSKFGFRQGESTKVLRTRKREVGLYVG